MGCPCNKKNNAAVATSAASFRRLAPANPAAKSVAKPAARPVINQATKPAAVMANRFNVINRPVIGAKPPAPVAVAKPAAVQLPATQPAPTDPQPVVQEPVHEAIVQLPEIAHDDGRL